MLKTKRMAMIMFSLMLITYVFISNTVVIEGKANALNSTKPITSIAPVGATFLNVGFDGGVGFTFPNFNNGANFEDIKGDIALLIKQNGTWVSIDNNPSSGWIYDVNFGNWWDGPGGYWFNPVEETTYLRVSSKTNPNIYVEYTLNVIPPVPQPITSIAPAGATIIDVSPSGGVGFEFPRFNSGATFRDVKGDIALFVKIDGAWVSIDNNASSGWVYDRNFGNWWEGPGGYWFNPVDETTTVKIASKTNPNVYVEYTLKVTKPVRNSFRISNYDGRVSFTADKMGAIGLPLPKIDGGPATRTEIDNFVYEVKVDGNWVNILDSSITQFSYSANGYNRLSNKNQWGYWTDYIFGLWFQPIQENIELRIGYPLNGVKGGDISGNYVQYTFIGNPNAYRPEETRLPDIQVGTSNNSEITGWELSWSDEFNGTELDETKWNYSTGYYLNDDPGTWGWGNNELQHYTDSEDNVFVKDGVLTIKALSDPKSFPQDPNRVAPYSSGKITTQNKLSFKYGRIDINAKLPGVIGAWPAFWMLPSENIYGGWASSGEIDIMEARGRLPETTSGALHYGGEWPLNTYVNGDQTFPDGGRMDTDFHTYSLIWEKDMMSWYVDGRFFFMMTKEEWFSAAVGDNPYAPFDQEFYLIMNLALGGWFDGGVEPSIEDFPITMEVDYVRVYKNEMSDVEPTNIPVTGVSLTKTPIKLTKEGQKTTLSATVSPVNATNKKVNWLSSNPEVATIDASGIVTAVRNGTTSITVTTQDGSMTDTITVTVEIPKQLSIYETFPLKNGSFSQELTRWTGWSWQTNYNFINDIKVVDGKVQLDIPIFDESGIGSDKSAVQFKQTGIQLYKDMEYVISFDASSSVVRDIELVIQNSHSVRIFEKKLNIIGQEKRYTYSFKTTKDELVELNFLLGKYGEYEKHQVTLDNVVLEIINPTTNKIKNCTYSDGLSPWDIWQGVGAEYKVNNEKFEIMIPTIGDMFWSVQVSQLGLQLEEGKTYRLVFDMSSSIGRKIDVILESISYEKYLWETIDVNEALNTYTVEFNHKNTTDSNVKFLFALGAVEGQNQIAKHTATIDNVHLYEIPDTIAITPVDLFIEKILALPATITLADKEAVEAVRRDYNALQETEKTYIIEDVIAKLVSAESKITELEGQNPESEQPTNDANPSENTTDEQRKPKVLGYVIILGITFVAGIGVFVTLKKFRV